MDNSVDNNNLSGELNNQFLIIGFVLADENTTAGTNAPTSTTTTTRRQYPNLNIFDLVFQPTSYVIRSITFYMHTAYFQLSLGARLRQHYPQERQHPRLPGGTGTGTRLQLSLHALSEIMNQSCVPLQIQKISAGHNLLRHSVVRLAECQSLVETK